MKPLLVIAALALAGVAAAQEPSDLPTTETQPPPPPGALPGNWYPGMPIPQQPPAAGATTKPGEKEGPQGFFVPEPGLGGEVSVAPGGPPPVVPETHVVQKGDTLWDISGRYYRNPWAWPKLWSYNPQITNPHWIYPGDVIRLMQPGAAPPAPAPEAANVPHPISRPPRGPTGVFLRQTGFVETGELKFAGRIIGSKEEKEMLGALDEAYVEFPKNRPVQIGDRFTIFNPTDEVRHPVTGKRLGQMVEIFGEGEVRAITDAHIARVAILDSVNPIERGFLVGPLRRQFKIVPPTTDRANLEGVIVATLHPRDLVAADNIVFLDKGQKDGVEIGNRFLVVRRGDGYVPLLESGPIDDKRFPRERIGEIIVVDLRDHLATGFMTSSVKEARVGDRVETRVGF